MPRCIAAQGGQKEADADTQELATAAKCQRGASQGCQVSVGTSPPCATALLLSQVSITASLVPQVQPIRQGSHCTGHQSDRPGRLCGQPIHATIEERSDHSADKQPKLANQGDHRCQSPHVEIGLALRRRALDSRCHGKRPRGLVRHHNVKNPGGGCQKK